MKIILACMACFLFVLSACGETPYVKQQQGIVIDPAAPNSMIANQLLLEFDTKTTPEHAIKKASACASTVRLIAKKPLVLLVVLPESDDYNVQAQVCLQLHGLVRAEWNQKKSLR